MYVFEFKGNPPKKADKATLCWEKGSTEPVRNGLRIHLPINPMAIFYPLQDGKQFLFENDNSYWFGGTDEEPFLVQMSQKAINNYIEGRGSDDSFYNGLIPQTIARIESETNTPHRRQGDIFAARFCGNDSFIGNLERVLGFGNYPSTKGARLAVKHGSFSLFGTRHEGKGTAIEIDQKVLFSGVVKAPDHAPLSLEDGLYVIDQTQHIVYPTKAD